MILNKMKDSIQVILVPNVYMCFVDFSLVMCGFRGGTVKALIVKLVHGMILPCLTNTADGANSHNDDVLDISLHTGLQRLQGIYILLFSSTAACLLV